MSSDSSTWSCTITLRMEFEPNGTPKPVSHTETFATTTRKDDVEIYLRRAQAAILSTKRRPAFFLKKSAKELKELASDDGVLPFSKNTIEVSLKSPTVTDLAFVDLPGRSSSMNSLCDTRWLIELI